MKCSNESLFRYGVTVGYIISFVLVMMYLLSFVAIYILKLFPEGGDMKGVQQQLIVINSIFIPLLNTGILLAIIGIGGKVFGLKISGVVPLISFKDEENKSAKES